MIIANIFNIYIFSFFSFETITRLWALANEFLLLLNENKKKPREIPNKINVFLINFNLILACKIMQSLLNSLGNLIFNP